MTSIERLTRDRHGYLHLPSGVPQHRWVYLAANGCDVSACYWCGRRLVLGGSGDERLTVDHLNWLIDDNRPENLVAACGRCNSGRQSPRKRLRMHSKMVQLQRRNAALERSNLELAARVNELRVVIAMLGGQPVREMDVAHSRPASAVPVYRQRPAARGTCREDGCVSPAVRRGRCDDHAREFERQKKQRQRRKDDDGGR